MDQFGIVVGERLREVLRAAPIDLGEGDTATVKTVTYSGGIASADVSNGFDADTVVARADAALYTAKCTGRDRVIIASDVDQAVMSRRM